MKGLLSSAGLLLSARLAGAVLLLGDSFDYPNGPLVMVSGGLWTHHSGSVTGEVAVVDGRVWLNSSDSEDVNARLSGGPYDPAGTTNVFYAGFTVRFNSLPSAGGTYFALFKDESATGFAGRLWALRGGAATDKFRLGISSGPTISATNLTDLSTNTDYTVVVRLVNGSSAAKLWIDPTAESDPSAATRESASAFVVAAYAFRQSGGEGSLSIDDLRVGTAFPDIITNAPPLRAPVITAPPQSQGVVEGGNAVFSVSVDADPPPEYQWQFNGTNLPGATGATLTVSNATIAQDGFYSVVVSNTIDATMSQPAFLNVLSPSASAFSLLTYNMHGNGALNWSTNTAHVRAIGRQVQYLDPDIIAFQEVPVTNNGTAQMVNFVDAFRPGFYLVTNSADDGFIRSVILSRYPIMASRSRLHASSLAPFGYNGSGFTRDLFEAEMVVPGFPQPLHVFAVHLKSGQDTDSSNKRAAEAGAISNYFVTGYLITNSLQPYILAGDLNEDLMRPPASDPQSIERLISAPVGLRLTTPFNPVSRGEHTFSIQGTLDRRYDYVLPNGLLSSNVVSGQVFRTDLLNPLPPGLFANDDVTASDHLPVMLVFANPYDKPFRLLSIERTNPAVRLTWQSVPGQSYRVDASTNLTVWTMLASNLVAVGSVHAFATNLASDRSFFRVFRAP